ncbi:MAG TPA: transglycosylase domain-containing protein [Burkholderiaceae bacterium]
MYALVLVFLWRRYGRLLIGGLLLGVIVTTLYKLVDELQTSRLQAARLSKIAREMRFAMEAGPSASIRFPGAGPYDERLGYHQLPQLIERLKQQGYGVAAQARSSPQLVKLGEQGLFAPYREKDQAGLELRDCRGDMLFAARYPERVYERFEAAPPLLVSALLFIENRELLDAQHPTRNPAIEWDRLGKAVVDQVRHMADESHPAPGASTLATQIEKYRHSPEGRTESAREKLRQMASASLRAYLDGEDTLPRRRQIVLEYLNTVPLAAKPGFGEVNGLGDGLWAWYGRDFAEVNRLLADAGAASATGERLSAQALAFRQALSLMIAQRRPTYYLGPGAKVLGELTNSYLRVMSEAGLITPALRDAALPLRPRLIAQAPPEKAVSFVERKAATAVRTKLSAMLEVPRAYDLDRFDLAAGSTLDGEVQRAATRLLRGLKDPAEAKAAGLYGYHLLNEGDDTSKIVFSFTLFERGEQANLLRVQTDNVDQPFDLNEGAKLDLGSTAKLRTLITYLELVAELHDRWRGLDAAQLAALELNPKDMLARWAREHLQRASDKSLEAMLDAAMLRTFSASPAEGFFTGGGLHHFQNFEPEDNHRVLTLREAFKRSVNLVFIRVMREVVYHMMAKAPTANAVLLKDGDDPARRAYLERFADKEGREFLARFYRKYQGRSTEDAQELLLESVRDTPKRLASVFYGLEPQANAQQLSEFLSSQLPGAEPSEKVLRILEEQLGPGRLSLTDRGFVAGVHPLELWLVAYLRQHPKATVGEVFAASVQQRQEVYGWLFRTRHKSAQDSRIRGLLEIEAFLEIHRTWKRLGYPFESLTPSYATSIGASGDRPAALAELMGIIVNRGVRLPVQRIGSLQFARDTPYETRMEYQPTVAQRVLPAAVADVVRRSLLDVVEEGTAKRLKGTFVRRDGSVVPVGGKTGTGDHRFDVYGKGGQLVSSRVVNRSATFVFLIGDRYFGTMMAYVHEPYAAKYKFTSAMPAQLVKALAPALLPLLERSACTSTTTTEGDSAKALATFR